MAREWPCCPGSVTVPAHTSARFLLNRKPLWCHRYICQAGCSTSYWSFPWTRLLALNNNSVTSISERWRHRQPHQQLSRFGFPISCYKFPSLPLQGLMCSQENLLPLASVPPASWNILCFITMLWETYPPGCTGILLFSKCSLSGSLFKSIYVVWLGFPLRKRCICWI